MSHLQSIKPGIAALLTLAAGLGLVAVMLAGNRKPQAASTGPVTGPSATRSAKLDSERPAEHSNTSASGPSASDAEFIGVTIAREAIEVAAPFEGRLEAVYVNLGDRLKPGDRIGRLNSDSI